MRPKSLASTMNSRVCTAASLGGLHVHICQVYDILWICPRICCMHVPVCVCISMGVYSVHVYVYICIHVYIYISYMNAFYSVCVYIYMCIDCSKKWRNDTPSGQVCAPTQTPNACTREFKVVTVQICSSRCQCRTFFHCPQAGQKLPWPKQWASWTYN